jgi:iron complex outermembrane receptor protein
LRLDRVEADASKADLVAAMATSPNDLYTAYYGITAAPVSENNVSALARFEKDLNRQTSWHIGLSRTVRTADATERYLASNNSNVSMRWVGNPGIKPEAHHQLEVGVKQKKGLMQFSGLAYYNRVSDYILRDRAHLPANNATIYRNIDARLIGFETEWSYRISRSWFSRVNLDSVHATNLDDNRPIAQTPPLMASLNLEYKNSGTIVGGTLRMAAKQTRVDTDASTGSGLDVRKTPGYAVFDFYGSGKFAKGFTYRVGIDNVFDATYAEHLNKSNAFDATQVQVNEPGRSFWVELAGRF